MKNGKSRFEFQISKLEKLFNKAKSDSNSALWLFLNDLRTPIFMLEGLSKLYSKLHNEKAFTKFLETFKALEDALGAVDYYFSFKKEFALDANLPKEILGYFEIKTEEKLRFLELILNKNQCFNGKLIRKTLDKLEDINWLKEEQEIKEIKKYYNRQIEKIDEFLQETSLVFDNIEEDVHELRRKIRWLSIYPQALNGAVKFVEIEPLETHLKKYLTENIINSPFNKLPENSKITNHLLIEKNHFLALSWIIAELGKIKDKGLKINVLIEAYQHVFKLDEANASKKVMAFLGDSYPNIETLLTQASEVSKTFFEEKILEDLIK
jgi:hypothetical protein